MKCLLIYLKYLHSESVEFMQELKMVQHRKYVNITNHIKRLIIHMVYKIQKNICQDLVLIHD